MKRVLSIIGISIFILGLITFIMMYSLNYSSGYRAGTISKMSHKGTIFKTYEGQLHIGGMVGSGGSDMTSGIWDFSVERDQKEVLEKIEEAVDGGYRVKLYYNEKYFKFFWRGDTKYFVDKVERVGASTKGNSENESMDNSQNNAPSKQ